MQFLGLRPLRRNWRVAIFGLSVTIVLVAVAAILVPAKYVATSQLVLLPPLTQKDTGYNGVVNPYLGLDALDSMADVVSRAMMDGETSQALQKAGVSQYTVTYDPLSAGPLLIVTTDESSPRKAIDALAAVTNQVPLTVARLQGQASISPSSYITADVIARPSTPVKSGKTQLRAIALALVCGLVLTLLAVSCIDSWRIRRRLQAHPAGDALGESNRERVAADGHGPSTPGGFRSDVPASESASDRTRPLYQ